MAYVLSFSPSLPALDWQLPSCSGPYNLQIEVQPKSHHRAHYETEGSRGAVKALSGGHPVVQVCHRQNTAFLGTLDSFLQAKAIFVCLTCVIIFCHYKKSGNTDRSSMFNSTFLCQAVAFGHY